MTIEGLDKLVTNLTTMCFDGSYDLLLHFESGLSISGHMALDYHFKTCDLQPPHCVNHDLNGEADYTLTCSSVPGAACNLWFWVDIEEGDEGQVIVTRLDGSSGKIRNII